MDKNIEMLHRAKMYLEQLANGYDPFTGTELPGDTVLNNVRISRCFFFVAGVLREVIENGGTLRRPSKQKLSPFAISDEERSRIALSDEPLQISKFCDRINEQIDTGQMRKLQVTAFGKWLLSKGFLEEELREGKRLKRPSALGEQIGIISEFRTHADRQYYARRYHRGAQQFLLDNLDEIIAISNGTVTLGEGEAL